MIPSRPNSTITRAEWVYIYDSDGNRILDGMAGINVIGMDVVEVAPACDVGEITALEGATLAAEFICLFAANPHLEEGRR